MRLYGAGGGAVAMFGAEMMRRQAEQAAVFCQAHPGTKECLPQPWGIFDTFMVIACSLFVLALCFLAWRFWGVCE